MIGLYLLLKKYWNFRLYKWHILIVTAVGMFGILEVLWALQKTAFPGVLLGGNYIRVPATFYDANHLPAYLLTALPFLLVLFWQAKGVIRKTILAGLVSALTLLLLSTFSRSGMIGFSVTFTIFWLLLLTFKYYKKALMMGGIAIVVMVAALLTAQTEYSLFKRVGSVLNPAEKSTTAHETLLKGEWKLFLENPVLGVGYGSFSESFRDSKWGREHLYVDPTQNIRLPAHSIWLEVLTETGILGFIPYTLAIGLVLLTLSKALRRTKNKNFRLYLSALSAGLVGILTAGIFYSYNLEFFFFYLFFCYLFAFWAIKTKQPWMKKLSADDAEPIALIDMAIPVFLTILTGIFAFYRLGATGLLNWDEAIYAGIAKNIIKFKDPLTLRWLGDIAWFEKPPLYMWLSSIMIFFYGITSFAARFWSALFGVAGVLVTYFFGRELFKSRLGGFLAAVMLATTTVYLYYSRNGMLDITFTALSTLGLFLYWKARSYHLKGGNGGLVMGLSGAAFGLAAMTKGFVVIIPLGIIGAWELLTLSDSLLARRKRRPAIRNILPFLLSSLPLLAGFFIVAAPWHLAMFAKHGGEFFDSYFIYHVFKRGTEAIEGKGGSLLWYLTVIKVGFRIWAIPLLLAVPYALYKAFKKDKTAAFLLLWAGVIFAFFSLAKSKLIWYIIPIYPPLSLLNTYLLLRIFNLVSLKSLKSLKCLKICLALGVVLIGVGYLYFEKERVYPPDFTKEEVALIRVRDQLDRRNNILFLLPGFASPVPRYYNEGPVREVTKEELPELLRNEDQVHFLASFEEYLVLKSILKNDSIELIIIGSYPSSGNLVLVERVLPGK
jgi:4-amino-4-deoxy-L-arabinose transferase-like glycosyltransferase